VLQQAWDERVDVARYVETVEQLLQAIVDGR
jgi:hypothetical protein